MTIERAPTPNFDRALRQAYARKTIKRLHVSRWRRNKPYWFWILYNRPDLVFGLFADVLLNVVNNPSYYENITDDLNANQ